MQERRIPGDTPGADVPPKPHEFPEYEDTPTDVHDDGGPDRKREPGQDSPDTRDPGSTKLDSSNE